MRRKLTALGGGAALVLAAITIPATTAAANNFSIEVHFPANTVQAESTLSWSITDGVDDFCDDPTIIVDGGSDTENIISIDDDATGEIDLAASAAAGLYNLGFKLVCDEDEYSGSVTFHTVDIHKQVVGDYDGDEDFEAEISVENDGGTEFEDTMSFSFTNQTNTYYGFEDGTWTVEETEDRGAKRVDIHPSPLTVDDPGASEITITNYFPHYFGAQVTPPSDFITTETDWTWESEIDGQPRVCTDGEVTSWSYDPVTDIETELDTPFEVSVNDDGYSGTIDVSSAPESGIYWTDVLCEDDGQFAAHMIDFELDVFTLTKDVKGDAPKDAEFEIVVTAWACQVVCVWGL